MPIPLRRQCVYEDTQGKTKNEDSVNRRDVSDTVSFHIRAGPPAVGALAFSGAICTAANMHGFCSSLES
jgi:hypothetical protein